MYRLPYKDEFVTCPYNSAEQIPYKTMQTHLIKCKKIHKHQDKVTCPFNARHHVNRSDLAQHKLDCPFRVTLQREIIFEQNKNKQNGTFFGGDCSVPSYRNNSMVLQSKENWDNDLPDNPQTFIFGETSMGSNSNGVSQQSIRIKSSDSSKRPLVEHRRPATDSVTGFGRGRAAGAVKKPAGLQGASPGDLLLSMARGRGANRRYPASSVRPDEPRASARRHREENVAVPADFEDFDNGCYNPNVIRCGRASF